MIRRCGAIYKLVISDADGTLLKNSKLIDARTFDRMIKELGRRGIPMVIASGRTYPELQRLFSPYEKHLVYIPLDGAIAVAKDTLLCGFPLGIAAVSDTLRLMDRADVRGAAFCTQNHTFLLTDDETLIRTEKTRLAESLTVYRPETDMRSAAVLPSDEPIYKIILYTKRFVTAAPMPLPAQTRAVYRNDAVTELVRSDVSKRRAAEVLCEALHLSPDTLLVYGDGENDRELLTYAAEAGGTAVTIYGAKHDLVSVTRYHTQNVAASVLHFLGKS